MKLRDQPKTGMVAPRVGSRLRTLLLTLFFFAEERPEATISTISNSDVSVITMIICAPTARS